MALWTHDEYMDSLRAEANPNYMPLTSLGQKARVSARINNATYYPASSGQSYDNPPYIYGFGCEPLPQNCYPVPEPQPAPKKGSLLWGVIKWAAILAVVL